MTLDQLAQEVATELGEQYGDPDIAEQFQKMTQESYDELITKARWLFQNDTEDITPVNGQAEYTLPSTVAEIRAAYIPTDPPTRVSYYTIERLISRGDSPAETGTPSRYFWSGMDTNTALKVQLWPVPDAAFVATGNPVRLAVLNRPTSLGLNDTIPLPPEYVRVVKDGVRFRVYMNDDRNEQAAAFHTRFSDGVELLRQRFGGPAPTQSRLRVKRIKATRQAPGAAEEG